MEEMTPHNWTDVKNVKFHHKVKRFYHKNLFRKIYTVAIIGLIGANVFSMVKYSSFADELEGLNQAPVINQVAEDEEIIPDWLELGMDDSDLNEISTDISPVDDKEDGSTVSGEVVEDLSDSLDEVHLAAPETDKEEIKIQATEDNPSNLPANWQYGTITLVDQQNPTQSITIMDRNLGATTNDITDQGSYGYYYQWGRNYGFPGAASCNDLDDEGNGICEMSESDAELFGDYNYQDYNGDVWYVDSGPCPEGWHIMEGLDFSRILENYGNAANILMIAHTCASIDLGCGNSSYNYDTLSAGDRFINYFRFPFAGYRRDGSNLYDVGYQGRYRITERNYSYNITDMRAIKQYTYGVENNGFSVRCVSDNYEYEGDVYRVSFYDGENNEPFTQYVAKNQRAIQPEAPEDDELSLDEPQNRRYIVGWNTSDGERYDFSTPVTSDLNLYAEWVDAIRYEDGYIKVSDGNREIWLKNGNQGVDSEDVEKIRQVYDLIFNGDNCYYVTESLGESNYRCDSEGYAKISSILGVQINDMGDIDDYISEHIYGNYYFWGNNEDMSTEHIIGEMQGKMGLDEETGWEEGSDMGNPCDSDEGEYLPTPDDWEELMSIWSNINGENHDNRYVEMSIPDGRERYSIGLNDYQKFANDMLIPDAGYYAEGFLMDQCSLDLNIQCGGSYQRYYYNNPSLLWTAKSDRGLYGIYNASDGYLGRTTDEAGDRQYVYNWTAAPVRCFIDPDEVNGVEKYTVTFDTKGGNETVPAQTVKEGKNLKEPSIPTRDGYTFDGWYTSNGIKWIFDTDTVQGEMTLSAKRRLCGEGFVVEDNKCIPEGMELNGVIKVTGELGTMYIRDRNVGVTSDAAVKWLKFNTLDRLVENECNQSNNYRVCWDTKGLNKFNKIFGTNYTSIEEARNELYYELQLEVLEGVLSEKEMTAFEINMLRSQCSERNDQSLGTSSTSDGLNVNSMYTDMDCMDSALLIYVKEKFNKTFENVDEAYDYLEEYFGSDVDLVYEIWNAYDGNYYTYNGDYINFFIDFYDLNLDAQAYGNYYYRGNNSGVNYNDIKFEDPNDDSRITNTGDLIKKGFTEGKIGVEGQGWIDGNPNPCDPEKGEYLPTPEDWKNLMQIWGNANGYQLEGGEDGIYNYEGTDYPEYYYRLDMNPEGWNKWQSDLLLPEGGNIREDMCRNEDTQQNDISCTIFDSWSPLSTSQDEEGRVGEYDGGKLYYTHYNAWLDDGYRPDNNMAVPVRCFVNPAEIPDVYVVSYETNGGNEISDVNVIGGDTVILPTPSKANYTFGGWYTDKALTQAFNSSMPVTSDLTLYAKWTQGQTSTPVSSYSGGGKKKAESVTNMHNSADEKDSTQNDAKGSENTKTSTNSSSNASEGQTQNLDMNQYNTTYTPEQNRAYQFAKSHGITTTSSIREAKMNTPLTRIEMAKMLSYYAVNLLGQQPQHGAGVARFSDVPVDLDEKYDYGVALAYQLGIMGINMPNNEFRPYDKVTRAEFATALSRMIYGMEDGKGRIKYYEPHMARLYNEGIINNTNPKMQELRGYVMTMLMRTVK